ncbi:MAG: two-component sensor histidine kinase [Verrucomicrobiaceae bacterium]|nr:two-component sensor histidine kinase [Verrucomicrobiaceae bacterium]
MYSVSLESKLGWRSSILRFTLTSGLILWILNSAVVIGIYDFTLRALVGDIGHRIDVKIDRRLQEWPKQLPQHAGVTGWIYRQLAIEIADLQDCVALRDRDGETQIANINLAETPQFRYRNFYTATFTGHRWQNDSTPSDSITCLVTERVLTDGGRLTYGVPFDSYLSTIQVLSRLRLWGLVLTAIVTLGVPLMLGLRIVQRLRGIQDVCDRVATGDLKQRAQITNSNDDIDRIAAAINHMLDQIEQLMEGVREVSDAIAHDLKTPLARLRGQLELLLSISERSDDAIDAVIAEADQVLNAFNALLRIAQLEQGTRRQAFIHFDFRVVLEHVRDIYELVFADKNIQFQIEQSATPFPVYGDRELWLQTVSNLLDNAYKYTPEGGSVSIAMRRTADHIELKISDSGPGIPRDEHKNVFKRFYRLDKHRSQKGTGLGLSLVAAVCKVHNASIALDNVHGLVVTIEMPLDVHAEPIETTIV